MIRAFRESEKEPTCTKTSLQEFGQSDRQPSPPEDLPLVSTKANSEAARKVTNEELLQKLLSLEASINSLRIDLHEGISCSSRQKPKKRLITRLKSRSRSKEKEESLRTIDHARQTPAPDRSCSWTTCPSTTSGSSRSSCSCGRWMCSSHPPTRP